MRLKILILIIGIFLIFTLSSCDSVEEFLGQEQIANVFSDFAPDLSNLLTGNTNDFSGKAEKILASEVSMEVDIISTINLMPMIIYDGFYVNVTVESLNKSDFIKLFTSTDGEEIPEDYYFEWEELQYLLAQDIDDVKIFYQEHRFDQGDKFDGDTIDNIINIIEVNKNVGSITALMEIKINNEAYAGHFKADFVKVNEDWKINNIEIILAGIPELVLNVTPQELELQKEEIFELDVYVYPENAEIEFITEDEEVVIVDQSGLVTAIGIGETVIIITGFCDGFIDEKVTRYHPNYVI